MQQQEGLRIVGVDTWLNGSKHDLYEDADGNQYYDDGYGEYVCVQTAEQTRWQRTSRLAGRVARRLLDVGASPETADAAIDRIMGRII